MKVEPEPQKTKPCSRCKKLLPLEEFGVKSASPDGRNCYCKECIRNIMNELRHNPKPPRQVSPFANKQRSLEERILLALSAHGPLSLTQIAILLEEYGPVTCKALQSEDLQMRLLNHEDGFGLTRTELRWQKEILREEICETVALMVLGREVVPHLVHGRRIYFLARPAVTAPAPAKQISLFQLAYRLGPKSHGTSAQCGRVEKRGKPEELELSAHSRVA